MTTQIEARNLHTGDNFAYDGRVYTAYEIERLGDTLRVRFGTSIYDWMSFYLESAVDLMTDARFRPADPKPFVVYTRRYLKSGECKKNVHRFATRAQQNAFMGRTTAAVTYYN